jgi:hypothetical protein
VGRRWKSVTCSSEVEHERRLEDSTGTDCGASQKQDEERRERQRIVRTDIERKPKKRAVASVGVEDVLEKSNRRQWNVLGLQAETKP